MPTKEAINAFLDFIDRSHSSKTHRTYKDALQTFVGVVGEDAPLTKDTYIKFLLEETDVSPSTQALYRSAIKGLYYHAADTIGGIDTSFFHMTDKRYALKPGKTIIMIDEAGIQKTLDHINTMRNSPEELRDRAFIFLMAESGFRTSEACNLRVGDIDVMEERAVIRAGKGNKDAVVKISNRTADAIRDYYQVRAVSKAMPLFLRHDERAKSKAQPVTPSYMWHYVKQRIKEAGADPENIRIHDFRHFFVTITYREKGIKTAQKWARHESIETTSRYTHLIDDDGEAYNDVFNKRGNK